MTKGAGPAEGTGRLRAASRRRGADKAHYRACRCARPRDGPSAGEDGPKKPLKSWTFRFLFFGLRNGPARDWRGAAPTQCPGRAMRPGSPTVPIYAYKCGACGHAQDVLQKVSDAPLSTCPQCGQETFAKQVTAAGFQLKGSGWYVTDFRNSGAPSKPASDASKPDSSGASDKASSGGDKPAAAASNTAAASA